MTKPPRGWRALLARLAAPRVRDALIADLDEAFAARAARDGPVCSRRWYRRHALRSARPLLALRWAELRRRYRARQWGGWRDDLISAIRSLRASPGFVALVVVVLALGIGASTAVFGVFRAVLLRPLPYRDAGQLLTIRTVNPQRDVGLRGVAGPDFFDYRTELKGFEQLVAFEEVSAAVTLGRDDRAVKTELATMSYDAPQVVGIDALLGRVFLPAEDGTVPSGVALISERLWRDRFRGEPQVVGRTIQVDGLPRLIVGVLPAAFQLPRSSTDIWVPMGRRPQGYSRRAPILEVVGRLASGTGPDAARSELEALSMRLANRHSETNEGRLAVPVPLLESIVGVHRRGLLILGVAVGALLLVACGNAAGLQLARAMRRTSEFSVRVALGAGRWRIVRQTVLESVILGLLAAGPGLLLAELSLTMVRSFAPRSMARVHEAAVDPGVLVFATGITLIAGFLASVVPTLQASKTSVGMPLRGAGDGAASQRMQRLLVVAQVGVSVAVLTAAVGLVDALAEVVGRERGIEVNRLVTVRVDLPDERYPTGMDRYPDWPEVHEFHARLLAEVGRLPGVAGAAVSITEPLHRSRFRASIGLEDRAASAGDDATAVLWHVSPGWTDVIGQTLLAGRRLSVRDDRDAPRVVLVNSTFARHHFGFDEVLGKRVRIYERSWEIVGVVDDVRIPGEATAEPAILLPFPQAPTEQLTLVVRTDRDPAGLVGEIRDAVWTVDASLAPYDARPLADALAEDMADPRFHSLLLAVFGAAGLSLGLVGIYGVVARTVQERRREIGVRMALGAKSNAVVASFLLLGTGLAGLGAACGLALTLVSWRVLAALLPEPAALSGPLVASLAALFVLAGAVASAIPARRAASALPSDALRRQ